MRSIGVLIGLCSTTLLTGLAFSAVFLVVQHLFLYLTVAAICTLGILWSLVYLACLPDRTAVKRKEGE